jgi:hypothetical protein
MARTPAFPALMPGKRTSINTGRPYGWKKQKKEE